PINIMIRRDGVPILIDFGTMKQTLGEEIAAQGDSGQVSIPIFNPLWAAPEQLRAEGAKHGPFTDVYAAAACMYYMLSGQAPVSAAQRQDDVAFNKPDPYKPLITVNQVAEVPAEVLSAVDRALAFMPEKRTPNIETFLQELRWQEGASVEAGIAINVLAAANGVVGKPYSGFNAVISGGSPPYRLNVSGLPRGIEASIADGGRIALSGTPRDFGHYGFTIDVNDDRARTGSVHSRIYIERASSNFLWLIGGVIAALIVAAAGIAHFTSRTERAAVSAGQPSAPQSAGTSGTQTASAPSNVTSPPINPPSTVSPELVAFNSAASCIDRENPCRTAALQDCLAGFNRQYASSSFSERLTARAKEHLETCTLPDGIYTGIRSWDNPKPPVCKASYAFTAVIRNGRISFTDDGLTGEGAVNQDTGFVTIENDGFRTADTGAPTRFTTYVRGSYEGAQMFNGNCRTGTFVINRSSFRPS
ncbi:MAG TPA: hypothetical protein VE986_04165, partial [Hyphomicrobiales bacterium]|nr:hypothetical protein [Hyphomicrobiales bacterium]